MLSQRSARHRPRLRRLTSMPKGQGSAAQHTPQPLQMAPAAGMLGASTRKRITWWVFGGGGSASRGMTPAFFLFAGAFVRKLKGCRARNTAY